MDENLRYAFGVPGRWINSTQPFDIKAGNGSKAVPLIF